MARARGLQQLVGAPLGMARLAPTSRRPRAASRRLRDCPGLAQRSVLAVPHGQVLDAWNFAGDVARGVGTSWVDRGWRRDGVYAKLSAASVAAPLGHPEWTPRWSPLEHRVLLDMARSAVRTVRAALDEQPE